MLAGNLPAEKLYSDLGFKYMDTLEMYYEDTGWTAYELYEYILNFSSKKAYYHMGCDHPE